MRLYLQGVKELEKASPKSQICNPESEISILLVDDDPLQLRSLSTGLKLEGFSVQEANCAEEALNFLKQNPRCLAIVDLMMPGVNGMKLTREIHKDYPHTRVILTSAYHISEKLLDRAKLDILGFLPKPFRLDDLVNFLRTKINYLAQLEDNTSLASVK